MFVAKYWKTLLFFIIMGLVGGFLSGLYLLDSYPEEIQQMLVGEIAVTGLDRIPINLLLGIITALQAAGYGLVLGVVGILLAKRIGLWRDETDIRKKPLLISLAVGIAGGLAMILFDILLFGRYSDVIMDSYAQKPTILHFLAGITYGAVVEEVMLRLFAMSLVAFILYKLFQKDRDKPSVHILVAANVAAALLFAASHLPATFMIIGNSPMILFRCFLLNGGIGLLFGYLYRKFGLRYAMLAHGGCHIVSKLIWVLFL